MPVAGIERLVNEADRLDLIAPDRLRDRLGRYRGQRGVARLRRALDVHTFRYAESELERRFLRLVRRAGLPLPETQRQLGSFRVDFAWPTLKLIVETDGLRHHRTAAQQARDQRRDQAHAMAGWTTLRFSHGQLRFEAPRAISTLRTVIGRLEAAARPE
jgi:very-short-patch-repair endonuclease